MTELKIAQAGSIFN